MLNFSSFSFIKKVVPILSIFIIVPLIVFAGPPDNGPDGIPPGGRFSVYFTNIIQGNDGVSGACPTDQVIVGFNTGLTLNYGKPICKRVITLPDGLTGQTLRNTGTGWIISSLLYNNGTNVGINTTNPATKLDVNGSLFTRGAQAHYDLSLANLGTTQWVRVGTLTAPQNGVNATLRFYGGSGYNANSAQNGEAEINIRTSNGASVNATGFCASARVNRSGRTHVFTNLKIVGNAAGCSATSYDVYILAAAFIGRSYYTVDTDYGTTWSHILAVGQADPGVASSTVLIPDFENVINDNLSVIGNQTVSGNLGVGTTTPGYKLDVSGTGNLTGLRLPTGAGNNYILTSDASGNARWLANNYVESDPQVGANTTNYLSKWNGSALVTSQVFDNGTNVGIGTATPTNKFQINTPLGLIGFTSAGSEGSVLKFYSTGGQSTANIFNYGGDNETLNLEANGRLNLNGNIVLTTNGTGRVKVDPSGNIGIGTMSPGQKLDVSGGSIRTTNQLISTLATGTSPLSVSSTTVNTNLNADLLDGYTTGNASGNIPLSNGTVNTNLNADMVDGLHVNSTSTNNEVNKIVRTDASGYANFGWINTTSGDNGTTAISRIYASSDGYIRYYTPANFKTNLSLVDRSAGTLNYIPKWTPDGDTLGNSQIFDNGTNVGIGTAAPGAKLDILGSGIPLRITNDVYNDWVLQKRRSDNSQLFGIREANSNGSMSFVTANVDRMTVDSIGNVGIGTSTPSVDSYGTAANYKLNLHYIPLTNSTVDDVVRITSKYNAATGASAAVGSGPSIVFAGGIGDNQTRDRARIAAVYEGGNVSGLAFHTQNTADIITEKMRIQNNGNVGIGTTSPGQKLDVSGGSIRTTNQLISTLATGTAPLAVSSTTVNTNLNADLLDGQHGSYYAPATAISGTSNYVSKFTSASTVGNSQIFDNGTNVGIGTASPGGKLTVAGSIGTNGTATSRYYDLVEYNNSISVATGTIIITLPSTKHNSNTMLSIKINGYSYNSNGAWSITLGGYNYTTGWVNTSLDSEGRPPFTNVRLGSNGTSNVILLGNTSTIWSYPKVVVSEVIAGHSSYTGWGTGWSTSLATAETGITITATPTFQTFMNASGNVGIGTTSPGQKLDVSGGSIRTTNQFISTLATGTPPLAVSSTTVNANLNADLLDGYTTGNASGNIPLSNGTVNTNLNADLLDGQSIAYFAPIASPALTGTPTAPTAAVGTNTTQLATTQFVNSEIANDAPTKIGGGASGTWGISITGNAATATNATRLSHTDNRIISPSEVASNSLNFGFTSFSNNNTSPYADFIHMRSYGDASGGNDNLLVFNKSSIGARLYQQTFGSVTDYSAYKDFLMTDTNSQNATINGDLTVVGKVITDTLVNRTVAQLTVSGSIFPNATSSQKDLGAIGNRWNNLYLTQNAYITGSVYSTAGFVGNGTSLTSLNPANISAGTAGISISGNAATATNSTQLGGIAASSYIANRGSVGSGVLDTVLDNSIRSVGYPGHSRSLLSFNVGGSPGTIQQEFHYNPAVNGWRIRGHQDSTTWNPWSYVVMSNGNQGTITGTILHTGNYNSYTPTLLGGGASGTWGISITGNATTATTLQTARTIGINGKVTGTATSFSGGSNITINTTAVDATTLNTYTQGNASGNIPLSNGTVNTNLNADLLDGQSIAYFAPIASPALTGTPTAPTAAVATNTTQIATTAFVKNQGYLTGIALSITGTLNIAPIFKIDLIPKGSPAVRTTSTGFLNVQYVYGPFAYAQPACPAGTTKQYKLFAEFVDNITSGGQNVAFRIALSDGTNLDFNLGGTWGGAPNYRTYLSGLFSVTNANHGYSQIRINGTKGPYVDLRNAEIWTYCIQ